MVLLYTQRLASWLRFSDRSADAGLLASVTDRARAEVFDNFLDHAQAHFGDGHKNEAGVIAGVVFEDTYAVFAESIQ